MEIIKDNTKPILYTFKVIKCPYCKSLLRIDRNDYYCGYGWFINEVGQEEQGYFNNLITCPCCNKKFRA